MSNRAYRVRIGTSGILLLLLGALATILSVIYASSVTAFIGLGMIFWGAIFAYIRPGHYVSASLLNATATPALSTLNQTLNELEYNGKPIYLPPKYLNSPDETKIYIPKSNDTPLPTPEQIQTLESQTPSRNAEGLLLTPPGAELARLFEATLGTSFTRTDLDYLQKNMPRLMVESLEIATNLEIVLETAKPAEPAKDPAPQGGEGRDRIRVRITDSIYEETSRETDKMTRIHGSIGSPLTSAIACAIARSTGKPTIITEENTTDEGKTREAEYQTYAEAR
jgi:hypothetical protein